MEEEVLILLVASSFSISVALAGFGRGCYKSGGRKRNDWSSSESELGGERLETGLTVEAEASGLFFDGLDFEDFFPDLDDLFDWASLFLWRRLEQWARRWLVTRHDQRRVLRIGQSTREWLGLWQ